MTIGQAIKQGIGVTHRSWALIGMLLGLGILIGVAVVVVGVVMAVTGLLTAEGTLPPGRAGLAVVVIVLAALLALLGSVYVNGGLLGYLRQQIRAGQAHLRDFWVAGGHFFGRLFGQAMLILLIGTGILIASGLVFGVGMTAAARMEQVTLTVVVPLALVTSLPLAVGLYGFLLLSFAPISLVFDETGVVTALGRSIRFMRQRIGQLLVLTLIYLALYLATGLVTEWIPALLNTVVTATAFRVVVTVVFTLVSFCVNGYLNVLVAATLTSLYAGAQDGGTVVTADIPATS